MEFTEANGYDAGSISLHARIAAISSSEDCTYHEAASRLWKRISSEKEITDCDEHSLNLARKIDRLAKDQGLSFAEALDWAIQESSAQDAPQARLEAFLLEGNF